MEDKNGYDIIDELLKAYYKFPVFLEEHLKHSYKIRTMTNYMIKNFEKKPLVGCEIGVSTGYNALSLLNCLNIKKLYLIDPYGKYEQNDEISASKTYSYAKKRLKKYNDKIVWIIDTSDNAIINFDNEFFDFVYIDGNHDYEFVKRDILNYLPKVKCSGILGGHDFLTYHPGVRSAVLEFVDKHGFKLYGHDIDWWIVKK